MVLQRLGIDFERQYGYRPWVVETFVAPDQDGACFKAANFLYIGSTLGRGRRAKTNACTKTLKSIYVYELDRRWRCRLGVAYVDLTPTRSAAEGLDANSWAMNEFGGAPLGDTRWSERLVGNAQLVASGFGEAVTGLEADNPAYPLCQAQLVELYPARMDDPAPKRKATRFITPSDCSA